jgi:hypothetical protein
MAGMMDNSSSGGYPTAEKIASSIADQESGRRGAQNVAAIDAAVKAGVKHIVFMSAAGTRVRDERSEGQNEDCRI